MATATLVAGNDFVPDYALSFRDLNLVPASVELTINKNWMKRVENPHRKGNPHYEGILPLPEAIKIAYGNANPRYPSLDKPHCKDIFRSIIEQGDTHDMRNLGMWALLPEVSSKEVDKDTFKLRLFYPTPLKRKEDDPDGERAGISNGGTTYALGVKAALSLVEQYGRIADDDLTLANGNPMPFFNVRIYTDAEDMANDMAEAQNNNVQMPEWAITDLDGLIQIVKQFSPNVRDSIQFSPNQVDSNGVMRPYDMMDVIQRLTLCLWKHYPNGQDHPLKAYSSRGSLIDFYTTNESEYLTFKPAVAERVFALPEIIEEILPHARPKRAFKDRDWMRPFKASRKFVLTGAKQDFEVASAIVYPIAAAMRCLIKPKSGEFRVEPREFLERNKQAIYNFIDSAYRDYAKKEKGKAKAVLSAMGKDRGFWSMVYSTVYEIANPPKDM